MLEERQGEGVEDVHVGGHDQQDDVEGPGHIEAQLDLGMGDQTLAQQIALVCDVSLQLNMDHGRQRMTRRRVGQDRGLGDDRPLRPEAPDAAGDRRGRAADLTGQSIGRLQIVLLQTDEERPVQMIHLHIPRDRPAILPESGKPGCMNARIARRFQAILGDQTRGFHMRFAVLLASLALSAAGLPAHAQSQVAGSPAAAHTVDAAAVVAEVRRVLGERYVLPGRRPALDAVLAEGLASGRYAVTDGAILADRLNADLERVGRDRHLSFRFDPREAAVIAAGSVEEPGANPAFERLIRRANHGVTDLRLLPGNVRLMTYDGFHWIGAESAAALDTAMRFLAGGDAVIIDLRGNGGGDPKAVQYVISRFLPAGTPLTTFYMNGSAEPDGFSTLETPPEQRMIGKPLYILTSGDTGSAAEEFTGHVAGYHLGEIVGANTAGAAFRNDIVTVGDQFVLSVSVGRPVLASTGKDWEAVGHAPTVETEIPAALDVAHAAALRRLAPDAPAEERPVLEAVAEAMEARALRPAPALDLAAYAGVYGERTLTTDGARLSSRRGDGPSFPLIALGGNRFAVESAPAMLMVFEANGGAVQAMTVEYVGGPVQPRIERTAPAR